MKKPLVLTFIALISTIAVSAPPSRGPVPGNGRNAPVVMHKMPSSRTPRQEFGDRGHHHDAWHSRDLIGFGTGLVLGSLLNPLSLPPPPPPSHTPIVVSSPIVVQPAQVWVDGHYSDQVMPNGTIVRIWIPGHFEVR